MLDNTEVKKYLAQAFQTTGYNEAMARRIADIFIDGDKRKETDNDGNERTNSGSAE